MFSPFDVDVGPKVTKHGIMLTSVDNVFINALLYVRLLQAAPLKLQLYGAI